MVNFQEHIHKIIVIEQVPPDARALGHPVQPDAFLGIMDAVAGDQRIDTGVEFNAGHFSAPEIAVSVDIINVVAADLTEGRTKAAHYPSLPATEYDIIFNQVGSDGGFGPAGGKHFLHDIIVVHRAIDGAVFKPDVVSGGAVFPQGDPYTFTV